MDFATEKWGSRKKTRPKINMVKYTHMNMRLASSTSTNRIFLQFSKRKSFLLKALVCFSFARMINITYLAIFLFLIHHCACNLWSALSVLGRRVHCVQCTHSTRSRAIKSPKKTEKYSNTSEQIQCPVLTQHRTSVNFRWLRVNMNYSKRPAYVYLAHVFFPRSLLVSLW